MTKNKIKYGLKNVHYAMLDDSTGDFIYTAPVLIPGAVSISLSAAGDTTPFYADDIEYFTTIANNGYDGDLEVAILPDQFKIDALGEALEVESGVLIETSSAVAKPFALLFEFTGDARNIRHVFFNCKATRPNIDSQTKGKSAEPKTDSLTLAIKPLPNEVVKGKTTESTPLAVYNAWYDSVFIPESV